MEDGPSRLSSTIPLARALSVAGHPLLLMLLTVAAATRNWIWTAVLAASTVLPMTAIIVRNVRRGSWSDFDVSRRDQRTGLYRVAIPLVAITALILYFLDAGPRLMRGFAAAAVMLIVGVIGNRFLKISMHMMCAALCAVTLIHMYPWSALAIVPFVIALAWSRRKLERHTWVEIAVGLGIGAGAGFLAVL
jgi:hypothetical protein